MIETYITGMGVFLPNSPVTNDRIEHVLGTVNNRSSEVKNWVLDYNGIQSRHYALDPATREPTHTNAEMTKVAVLAALADAGVPYDRLECLCCGTSSADQILPHHGVMVHGLLGGHPLEAASTTGVCCSGMSAFKYAWLNVAAGQVRTAVSSGSELASVSLRASHFQSEIRHKVEDLQQQPALAFENEFLRWMLSDGAGAAVVSSVPRMDGVSLRIDWMEFQSFAHEAPPCMYYGCAKQPDGTWKGGRLIDDPQELYTQGYVSLAQDVKVLQTFLPVGMRQMAALVRQRHDISPDQIDWFLPHYSSEGFRKPLNDGLIEGGFQIPEERWFTNLRSKGNTGSASIYIILEELLASGRVEPGQRILCFVPESSRFSFAILHLTAV
jgi:3-oxoacyl-[acyl-carrier-protein] synthase-3